MPEEKETSRNLEYYLSLRYPVQLAKQTEDGDEYWLAEILDLPGCMSHGGTPGEAIENIEDAKHLWIETELEERYDIPEPTDARGYSGRLVLRMPKSLHRALAHQAKRERVSLNQLIVSLLAGHSRQNELVAQLREIAWNLGANPVASPMYRMPFGQMQVPFPNRTDIPESPLDS